MRRVWPLLLSLMLAGCVTATPQPDCASLRCLAHDLQKELALTCETDLYRYPPKLARLIDARYRYPLTNAETYFDLLRMGYHGPSPDRWCREYAQHVGQVTFRGSAFTSQ